MDKKAILIFGVGPLQKSIIKLCKSKGLFTVGIDPAENAICKDLVDAFEIVGGQDFFKTLEVAKKYNVSGIITAATDKPLVMMARIAEILNLPFVSVDTAEWSTDKLMMKMKFQEYKIPCAKGFTFNNTEALPIPDFEYPVIVKPRDNSGSRGVIYCNNNLELNAAVKEALQYTHKGNVLVEEYIEGKEYSVESIHNNGKTHVIQITEKITTEFPYNVELGHIQPADLTENFQNVINSVIEDIAIALKLDNCGSHTELKINSNGVKIIETSPRLGGDFISSTLVPLSTGIIMEDILINISVGNKLAHNCFTPKFSKCSGIVYFVLPEGKITHVSDMEKIKHIEGLYSYNFDLRVGSVVNKITSSLDRYGYAIFQTKSRSDLIEGIKETKIILQENVIINS